MLADVTIVLDKFWLGFICGIVVTTIFFIVWGSTLDKSEGGDNS